MGDSRKMQEHLNQAQLLGIDEQKAHSLSEHFLSENKENSPQNAKPRP